MTRTALLHDMSEAWVELNAILQTIGGANNNIVFGRGHRPPRESVADLRQADTEVIQAIAAH